MSPVEGGRLCASCDRRVVDFRFASDEEIVRAHAASDERVCGAYSPEQVARWSGPILISLTLGASLLSAAPEAHAASPSAVHAELSAEKIAGWDQDTLVVRGTVRDTAGAPLAGVHIRVAGTEMRTLADSAGRYVIRLSGPPDRAAPARLRFSLIGYNMGEVQVTTLPGATIERDVVLRRAELHLDGIVLTAYAHRPFWRRVLDRIASIF